MTDATEAQFHDLGFARRRRRAARPLRFRTALAGSTLGLGVVAGSWMLEGRATAVPLLDEAPAVVHAAAVAARAYVALLDPGYSLGPAPVALGRSLPRAATFEWAAAALPVPPESPALVVASATADPAAAEVPEAPVRADRDAALPIPLPPASPLVDAVPLPTPRPPELLARTNPAPFRTPRRQVAANHATPVAPADTRSFFERLFGAPPQPAGPMLAYAAPEDGAFGRGRGWLPPQATASADRYTAVYDIAAHTVTLPNGTQLEAHSGLGDRLDDPNHVSERMRGATPPHVYDLQPREQLFHGVRALRLTPVGGGSVYGRTGLLAHTYMLGPKGDSNGCVSFRNYEAFLQAYLNGDVRRLIVVARS